ncbi:MAG: TolC family protein [Chlorobi bacterium]|nr:TolC family protein [Chlorobiota bacterium]
MIRKSFLRILLLMIFLGGNRGNAQDTLRIGVRDAVLYALDHNPRSYKADNEVLKAKKKVWETTAMGLPQVSASINYQQFIDKPVQMMPARVFNPNAPADQYVPVSFGTDQNMKYNIQLNQLIFSGSYIVGLYSSRVYKQISENARDKTRQKLREMTVQAYGNAVFQNAFLQVMDSNITAVRKNLYEVKQMYANGLVEQTDVEQLELTLAELQNQKDWLVKMRRTAYEMLNYVLGRDPEAPLLLTDGLKELTDYAMDLNLTAKPFDPEANIDYQIAQNKVKAGKLKLRLQQSKFLPQIMGFYNYGKTSYDNEFTFFDKDKAWYEQSFFGIGIQIPIFGGLAKHKQVGQAKLDYLNAKADLDDTKRKLMIDYERLQSQYEHALNQVQLKKKNLALAEKIERKEVIKYREGVGNSFQLNQARLQLYQMQQAYLKSVLELLQKKTELESLLGVVE